MKIVSTKMSSGGKYVRAPDFQSDPEEFDEYVDGVSAGEQDSEGREKEQYDGDECVNDGDDSNSGEEYNDSEESGSVAGNGEERDEVRSDNSVSQSQLEHRTSDNSKRKSRLLSSYGAVGENTKPASESYRFESTTCRNQYTTM